MQTFGAHEYEPIYDNSRFGDDKPPDKVHPKCSCGWEADWQPRAKQAAALFATHIRLLKHKRE